MAIEDLPRHKGQRNKLIKILISKGIRDQNVLKAINKIPRHAFVDSSFEEFAYQDKAFPIAADQTISQPFTVAFQSMLLQIEKGDMVLEIGTGSGYQSAVLCELEAKVFSIERQKELFDQTSRLMRSLGYNLNMKFGDGFAGLPSFAPFDKIIVTCGAPRIPEKLLQQLKVGGRMVIPVGEGQQRMKLLIRNSKTDFEVKDYGDFRFVPMLSNKNVSS
jgi:protein-L-isoaspartate(D-aspartate) O-methyltransferase|tara:strand:+ start:28160 stop:28813 length:654 start_codon:yes stop_codon:yes gene_type:complete